MQRRINVSLSEEAVRLLDRMAPKGDRSRFLDELVKRTAHDRAELRARLKERAIRRTDLDRQLAIEWARPPMKYPDQARQCLKQPVSGLASSAASQAS